MCNQKFINKFKNRYYCNKLKNKVYSNIFEAFSGNIKKKLKVLTSMGGINKVCPELKINLKKNWHLLKNITVAMDFQNVRFSVWFSTQP